MTEKHKSPEKHPRLKWLVEKAKIVSDRAMKLGFSAAAIGALIGIGGYIVGAAAVMHVGGIVFNLGIWAGVLGGAGRLIVGDPKHKGH